MKKSLKVLGTVIIIAGITGCASPQTTKLPKQAYQTNSVNQFLKTAKYEFITLSPTETFVLGYKNIQLDLNKWCIEKGGTPYYYYKDQFGDYVSKKLIYYDKQGNPHPKYVTDLTDFPQERYVVCKLPNGKELYKYTQDVMDRDGFVATLIYHAPEKETYYWNPQNGEPPTNFKALALNTKCNKDYCYGSWLISDFSTLYNLEFPRPYIYCKYHLGGVLYKDGQRWEDWFRTYILNKKIGHDWDGYYNYITGNYLCYDGANSFKLIAKLQTHWTRYNDVVLDVYFKKAPELANQKPEDVSTNSIQTYANQQSISQPIEQKVEQTPNAFSSDSEIAKYVAKTGQPFNAVSGGVMVQATPVKEGSCTLVLIQRFNNGFLAERKSLKVCNNQVVSSSDVNPTKEPMPENIHFGLYQIIPQCQQYGKASTNFVGYTIECKALDENHCNLQITTKKGDKVLGVQTVNVCR